MTTFRTICVATGTRADYGILLGLLRAVTSAPDRRLQIIASAAHLSPEFGMTIGEIERDGFHVDACVEMLLSSDSAVGITKSIGLGTIGFGEVLAQLHPDLLVIPGDRYEALAAAQAALIVRVPIAHIHGGETTEGAFDESIRHAITKMAQFHFVAAERYRQRVIQMGEAPERVFNVGAPGLDNLATMDWIDLVGLESELGLRLGRPLFLVTYHPATLSDRDPMLAMDELLAALDGFPQATVVFTYSNADPGGRSLITRIEAWVKANAGRAKAFPSLGQRRYMSLLRVADVAIGNSSSAVIEAPALKVATVNIGDRQQGRLRATSIIDAVENRTAISAAIERGCSPQFRARLADTVSLYGEGGAGKKINDILGSVQLSDRKPFFEIEHGY
ncbi:MAG: UDP-N-acetylglucosamine 2-epimerase (hydrolyzing) [Alphaproteobacteria bacterium]|nr:UDP-N-acetylglucosamine 2-epimerase (hydrolyzing) [Alphaproteobacteria bacterium]